MLDFDEAHKRFVIPKWLSLARATCGRDLAIPRSQPIEVNSMTRGGLTEDYAEFKENPNPLKASDLMGAAFVVGEHEIALEAAAYFAKSRVPEGPGLGLANYILNPESEDAPSEKIDVQIARFKTTLGNFPRNPLVWIEVARLYTIKGQISQARRAVRVALTLAPSNRFVVRSAARFYMHLREFDAAWDCTKRALDLNKDPWIEATFINVTMALDKSPKGLIRGTPRDVSPYPLFHYSELIETRGMLELEAGNDRRARKDFRLAWMDPSENVVTHGEWVLRNSLPGLSESVALDLGASPEAEAWKHFWDLDLEKAMQAVREWALEEPYSRHPWILGSSVSCVTDRFGEAESLARQGLLANRRDFLLNNNLAFALLKDRKVEEAEGVLKTTPQPQSTTERTASLATRGLLEFKRGAIERGRELYLQAVEESKGTNDPRLAAKAFLNLAMAEVEAEGERMTEFVSRGMAAAKECHSADVTLTVRQLLRTMEKRGKVLAISQKEEDRKRSQELVRLTKTMEVENSKIRKMK